MKIENWCGYNIRFIEKDGEWWAILKDICDALGLRTDGVAQRLNPTMLTRVTISGQYVRPTNYNKQNSHPS